MESQSKRSRGRGRGRGSKARGRGRGRSARPRALNKRVCIVESDPEEVESESTVVVEDQGCFQVPAAEDLQVLTNETVEVISDVADKDEPMNALDWSHKVNMIGEKVVNPLIHCCDLCHKPILIYGRMIPCKHVFCLACSKQDFKQCPRCTEKVSRVEQTGLGSVFMCTHDGTRYGNDGCRRTYLSQEHLTIQHSRKLINIGVKFEL